MNAPKIGLQIIHNGKAIELLYKLSENSAGQLWRAKLLFVKPAEEDVLIRPADECRALH